MREGDLIARLGGDEFGIVFQNCQADKAGERVGQLARGLEAVGVAGSLGWASVTVTSGFPAAITAADEQMSVVKRARRAVRSLPAACTHGRFPWAAEPIFIVASCADP